MSDPRPRHTTGGSWQRRAWRSGGAQLCGAGQDANEFASPRDYGPLALKRCEEIVLGRLFAVSGC